MNALEDQPPIPSSGDPALDRLVWQFIRLEYENRYEDADRRQSFLLAKQLVRSRNPRILPLLIPTLQQVSSILLRQVLYRFGPLAIPELLAALVALPEDRKHSHVGEEIINLLGNLRAREALPVLLDLLQHDSPGAKSAILIALSKINDPRIADELMIWFTANPKYQGDIVCILAKWRDPRAYPLLFKPDQPEKLLYPPAAAWLGDPALVKPLLRGLADPSSLRREQTVWALRDLRAPEVIPALEAEVIPALEAVMAEDRGRTYNGVYVADAAALVLAQLRDAWDAKRLTAIMDRNNYYAVLLYRLAMQGLVRVGGRHALGWLRERVADFGELNWDLQAQAMQALGELGDETDIPQLEVIAATTYGIDFDAQFLDDVAEAAIARIRVRLGR